MRVLLIDNYDSFTYMLKDYIEQCGAACLVLRNDDASLKEAALSSNAIIISPGRGMPNQSGVLLSVLKTFFDQKPILGVCLGHQAIGEFFGAQLVKAIIPRHGKVDMVTHNGNELFKDIRTDFEATRYHSLLLQNVKSPLKVIASSSKNEVMALAHNHLPIYGIQFHPESCMTQQGIVLIKNFLQLAKQLA